jgi:hypothetical protein
MPQSVIGFQEKPYYASVTDVEHIWPILPQYGVMHLRRLRFRSDRQAVSNPAFGFPKVPGGIQTGFHKVGRRSARILVPIFPDACLRPAIIPVSLESEGEPTLSETEVTLTAVDFPLGHSL